MKMRKFAALCFLFVCLWLLFGAAQKIALLYPSVSLRYSATAPLTAKNVTDARSFAIDGENTNALFPTFWYEASVTARAAQKSAIFPAVYFLGSGADCYAATFLTGSYPGAMDARGCALSSEAAWQLFGSNDIIGQEIVLQKKAYAIRGAFQNEQPLCLVGATETAPFTAIELSGTPRADRRGAALLFLTQAGLPPPAQIVYGPSIATGTAVLCYVPVLMVGLCVLNALWRKSRLWSAARRQLFYFGVLLLFALLLPLLLAQIPAWMIPPKWSDFTFWTQFWETAKENLRTWFALVPMQKDIVVKLLLLRFAAIFFVCIFATGAAICMYLLPQCCKK